MRMVTAAEIEEELFFAKNAAAMFAKNPKMMTYTAGEIKPGVLFACRWGCGDDCVVVFKLADDHTPTNYQNLVRQEVE